MVQTCRQIIEKWPDSWYAYNAQKMLIDMPERFRERYKITQEELDISKFEKQRPGTEPFSGTDTVEEESP
jgi:outer membrane protein assembly factor BamD (BamD/ComL family)